MNGPNAGKGAMGDTQAGSSSAARSAQDPIEGERRGLFGRVRFALTGKKAERGDSRSRATTRRAGGAAGDSQMPGALNLPGMRVEDVAIPKAEIVSVPINLKKEELAQVFRRSGKSRLPVYDGTLDTPKGMVHVKDFALNHVFNGASGRFSLRKMLRPLLFAPPSMPIGVLFQQMKAQRRHMALVIDEYGGVDGLVTIEDLIEQVVGEIEDEHDVHEGRNWTLEKPGCYLAQAKMPLEEFEGEIGLRLPPPEEDQEIDTLGGLVFALSGRVPARGEVIRHPAGPEFEVVAADPRRIKRLRVRTSPGHGG